MAAAEGEEEEDSIGRSSDCNEMNPLLISPASSLFSAETHARTHAR